MLHGNDNVHAEHHQGAADPAAAAAAGCHDNSDAEEQFQFTPARHLLPYIRRALLQSLISSKTDDIIIIIIIIINDTSNRLTRC